MRASWQMPCVRRTSCFTCDVRQMMHVDVSELTFNSELQMLGCLEYLCLFYWSMTGRGVRSWKFHSYFRKWVYVYIRIATWLSQPINVDITVWNLLLHKSWIKTAKFMANFLSSFSLISFIAGSSWKLPMPCELMAQLTVLQVSVVTTNFRMCCGIYVRQFVNSFLLTALCSYEWWGLTLIVTSDVERHGLGLVLTLHRTFLS